MAKYDYPEVKAHKCIACRRNKFSVTASFSNKTVVTCNGCSLRQDIPVIKK